MNKERILALADLIEKQEHTGLDSKSGFNMGDFTHYCGTPACIAGWAIAMKLGDLSCDVDKEIFISGKSYSSLAGEFLGIGEELHVELFFSSPGEIPLDEVSPQIAASVLRHLAETGEVDWSIGGDA
jgi:hypothetical protein